MTWHSSSRCKHRSLVSIHMPQNITKTTRPLNRNYSQQKQHTQAHGWTATCTACSLELCKYGTDCRKKQSLQATPKDSEEQHYQPFHRCCLHPPLSACRSQAHPRLHPWTADTQLFGIIRLETQDACVAVFWRMLQHSPPHSYT